MPSPAMHNMAVKIQWSALMAAACAACGTTAAPRPLLGPAPRSIVIAPPHAGSGALPPPAAVAFGADRALRGRGYHVLGLAVGFDLLRANDLVRVAWEEQQGLGRIGTELDVDAVLVIDVRRWEVDGSDRFDGASYDLGWRLLSTRGAGLLWENQLQGDYRRPVSEPLDPTRRPDAQPAVMPFGGQRVPTFREPADLAAALHTAALSDLPPR